MALNSPFDFSNPMQFMQMLFSPEMNPQMLDQMAGSLAMKAQPPAFPQAQPPMPMGAPLGPEMLTPGQPPIPQAPMAPGLAPVPGLFPQNTIMPGEEAGIPQQPQMPNPALTAMQMQAYQKMLEPNIGPVISPPSPPGGRQIGAMQQLQVPQTAMPMNLAALLGRR